MIFNFDSSSLVELIGQLNIEDLCENVSLKRLNEEETSAVVTKLLDDKPVDKKLILKIFYQSEGNPLFISELLFLMKARELIKFENGSWKIKKNGESEIVSKKVQDIIKQRIAHLDDKTKEILQIASCEGEYFQSDILSGVLNINRLELLKLLQVLEKENRIIRNENKVYRFDHFLIREVLYDSIIPELKEEYHKLIAKWLIGNYGNKDEYACRISHHLILAGTEEESLGYLLRAANRARDLYAVEEALGYYDKLLDITRKSRLNYETYELAVEEGLGDVYITLGRSEEAFIHYEQYLKLARKQKDNLQIEKSLRKFAECNRIKGNLDTAKTLCSEAILIAEKISNKNEILESLNTFAFINASIGDYDNTIEISEKALNISEELNDQKNKSISLSNLGFAYWHLGNYPFAKEKFLDAISIQRSIGDNRGLSTTLNFLGMAYWKLGKYEDALECSEESVEIKNKISDLRKIPGSLNVIGDIYREIGDIEKAIRYHKKSLEIATQHQNKGAMCDNIRDLGEDYFLKGDFDQALNFLKEVQDLSAASNIKWYQTRTYISLSELYLTLESLDEAKRNIEIGLKYSYEIGAKDLIIEALWNQAKIKTSESFHQESDKLFEEAIRDARSVGHQTFLWKLLNDFGNYLSSKEDNEKAGVVLNEAREIAWEIYVNFKDENLKNIFINSEKVKKLLSQKYKML